MTADTDDGPVEVAFTGDTLFAGSIGRTDLPERTARAAATRSPTKLLVLDDDTVVLPGHGTSTTHRRRTPVQPVPARTLTQ